MVRKYQKFGLVLGTAALSNQVFAQSTEWTITYAPQATSVPTLSEWAMLALVLMMAAFAVYTLRKRGAGAGPLASVILVTALAFGAMTGEKVIGLANARINATMSLPAGGSISFPNSVGREIEVVNGSGVAQTITSVTPTSLDTTNGPTCIVGRVVQPGQSCWVWDGQVINMG